MVWCSGVAQDLLLQLLTDREMCANSASEQNGFLSCLPAEKLHQLLAARGLLASGLLLHCLQSRHRVDYGINRCALATCGTLSESPLSLPPY